MADATACVETAKSGDNYYIIDAKNRAGGPIDVISEAEYARRQTAVELSGDALDMFSDPGVLEHFNEGELNAYRVYFAAGRLAVLHEGDIVTAYESHELIDPELSGGNNPLLTGSGSYL
jgi:hypothetical protein